MKVIFSFHLELVSAKQVRLSGRKANTIIITTYQYHSSESSPGQIFAASNAAAAVLSFMNDISSQSYLFIKSFKFITLVYQQNKMFFIK